VGGQRRHHPADAQGRRERLGDRPEQHHPRPVGALHGPDRPAVVAELGVVVVLQDQAVDPAGPGEQGGAALGREHHPGRELVGGAHHDRAHRRVGVEVADPQPVAVDARRHDPQPGPGGGLPEPVPAGVLDRDGGDAGRPQGLADAAGPVGDAPAHRHLRRVDLGAAHPGQVPGQDLPEPGVAGRVGVAQLGIGQGAGDRAQRREPASEREGAQVGQARGQVDPGRQGRRGLGRRVGGGRPAEGSHAGPGADPGLDIALGGQLGVGLGDDPARAAEVRGQLAAGRQGAAGGQPAAPDRLPDGPRQPGVQRPVPPLAQLQERVPREIGLGFRHRIGPYIHTNTGASLEPNR